MQADHRLHLFCFGVKLFDWIFCKEGRPIQDA